MAHSRPANGWNFQGITTHPGVVLREEFLKPLHISQNKLSIHIRVPATRIGDIVHERRAITPDTALRLGRFFGNSPEFWLNLQQMHDLSKARIESAKEIEREVDVYCFTTQQQRIDRAQQRAKKYLNPATSLGDELIAERRKAARNG